MTDHDVRVDMSNLKKARAQWMLVSQSDDPVQTLLPTRMREVLQRKGVGCDAVWDQDTKSNSDIDEAHKGLPY